MTAPTANFEMVRNATCEPLAASLPSRPGEIEVPSGRAVLIIVESVAVPVHIDGGGWQDITVRIKGRGI